MDFKQRFKGKVSTMNKEGVMGIVKQLGQPIDKYMESPQVKKFPQEEPQKQNVYQTNFYEDNDLKKNMQTFIKPDPQRQLTISQQRTNSIKDNQKVQEPHQAKVFTNIQSNRNSKSINANTSQAFRNNAQMVLRNHLSQEPQLNDINDKNLPHRQSAHANTANYNTPSLSTYPSSNPNLQQSSIPLKFSGSGNNFSGLNMDEYDIIAVPKRFTNPHNDLYAQNQMNQSNFHRSPVISTSQLFRATTNEVDTYQNYHNNPLIKTYSFDPKGGYSQKYNGYQSTLKNKNSLMQAGMGSLVNKNVRAK